MPYKFHEEQHPEHHKIVLPDPKTDFRYAEDWHAAKKWDESKHSYYPHYQQQNSYDDYLASLSQKSERQDLRAEQKGERQDVRSEYKG